MNLHVYPYSRKRNRTFCNISKRGVLLQPVAGPKRAVNIVDRYAQLARPCANKEITSANQRHHKRMFASFMNEHCLPFLHFALLSGSLKGKKAHWEE